MTSVDLPQDALSRLREVHRLVGAWAERESDPPPAAVLVCCALALVHSVVEEGWLLERQRWLDPAAAAQLAREHEQFADDLALLDALMTGEPDSPDTRAFARALGARLREHLARDTRLFYAGAPGRATEQPARSGD
jgi:hypothetical protein